MMRLLGEVPERVAVVGSACLKPGIEDVAYMTLYFPSGVTAHIRMSWLDPMKTRRITVVGSKRMAVYDDVALNEKIKMYDVRVDEVPHTDTFGEFQFAYHHGDIVSPHVDFHEPVRLECLEFLGAIADERRPHTDGTDGLVVVRVIEAAQESLRNGGVPVSIGLEQRVERPGLAAIQGSVAR
jgi:predicted dehydrogenase